MKQSILNELKLLKIMSIIEIDYYIIAFSGKMKKWLNGSYSEFTKSVKQTILFVEIVVWQIGNIMSGFSVFKYRY